MRFDDSLDTVLSAEMASPFGAQSTWRQLVDLVGRGRVPVEAVAISRLRTIRGDVPPPVRAASARALQDAAPPAALVTLFAEDELAVAAPLLRTAQLPPAAWVALLARLSPAARSILRHRRDLHAEVVRALESFGSTDFVLAPPNDAGVPAEQLFDWADVAGAEIETRPPAPASDLDAVLDEGELLASDADEVTPPAPAFSPVAPDMLRRAERPAPARAEPAGGTFRIADLVARIDAYQRRREGPSAPEVQPEPSTHEPRAATRFGFETDAAGIVRWVEGASRAALIGRTIDLAALPHGAHIDGTAASAFRRRECFTDARMAVEGRSDANGEWRVTGVPVFDRTTGGFTGYRGTARRPHADERAERVEAPPAADALRQLVHELRTPTGAIAGFAEMIEAQVRGAVPPAYRDYATAIRADVGGLLDAIDDLDLAARIETRALDLRADVVPLAPLLDRILTALAPPATQRGTIVRHSVEDRALGILGDARVVERLIARLLATLVAASEPGERIGVAATRDEAQVSIVFDRPATLAPYPEQTLLTIDADLAADGTDAPLLGTGFALRLARDLAIALHGSLTIGEETLTLWLPAVFSAGMEQASNR